VDGSALERAGFMRAGWGVVAVFVDGLLKTIIYRCCAPICTNRKASEYLGAEDATNNTGELGAQYDAHVWGIGFASSYRIPMIILYDSTFAYSVSVGKYSACTSREIAARLRGVTSAHMEKRDQLAFKHVRGHAGVEYNELVDTTAKLGATEECRTEWRLHPHPLHLLDSVFPGSSPEATRAADSPRVSTSYSMQDDKVAEETQG